MCDNEKQVVKIDVKTLTPICRLSNSEFENETKFLKPCAKIPFLDHIYYKFLNFIYLQKNVPKKN